MVGLRKKTNVLRNIVSSVLFATIIFFMLSAIFTLFKGETPSILGYRLYYVVSGSMKPTIDLGSLIIVKEVMAKDIIPRDIITYKGNSKTIITHRVMKKTDNEDGFITRGDANNTNDLSPVHHSNIIGKVVCHLPYMGYLLYFLRTKIGLSLFMIIIILFLLRHHRKRQNISL